ncbi:MAG: GBS Bsp-like repeat-containing protein, partial [Christensenella sp.]|uniref:GBS Bsp-like repeat-containing protein n=1 Tax=Christensenella sp. TaxID=1935934 RepID=UPI002B1F67F4
DQTAPVARGTNITPYGTTGRQFHAGALDVTDESGIAEVSFAVWNETTGDVKWYRGNSYGGGDYGVLVDISNHGSRTGKYYVLVYATDGLGNQGMTGQASYLIR